MRFGCVFTQTAWDDEGYAIRDPDSTTYAGAIETASQFGNRIYLEAWTRGWSRAEKKVVIADGAEWIWNIAALARRCPDRRSVSCPPAPMGSDATPAPRRPRASEAGILQHLVNAVMNPIVLFH